MEKKKRKRKTPGERIFAVLLGLGMVLVVVIVLYPFMELLVCSFTKATHVGQDLRIEYQPTFFENYYNVLSNEKVLQGMLNSILRTILGTVLGILMNTILAFVLSRREFRFRSALTYFWIVAICLEAGIIPMLAFMQKMSYTGTLLVYFIPGLVNVVYVFAIRAYMDTVPEALVDQARLDGASYGDILLRIVVPVCKPVLAAVVLYIAAAQWNAWMDTLLYNRYNVEFYTLQYEVMKTVDRYVVRSASYARSDFSFWGRAALLVIAMLPIVILGLCMQKYYLHSVEELFTYAKKKH